jgi:hypothetical protein
MWEDENWIRVLVAKLGGNLVHPITVGKIILKWTNRKSKE